MKFKLEIECDNAAFGDEPAFEVARILRELAEQMERNGSMAHPLWDYNGNRVGRSTVEPE